MSTITDLTNEINAALPDNNTKLIAPAAVRQVLIDMVSRLETDITSAPGGGSTFTGTGDPGLTRAQAISVSFTTPPNAIRTTGFYTAGDEGGNLHVKVNSQPAHGGWFQTADGTYYEMIPEGGQITLVAFGGQRMANRLVMPATDSATDNFQYFLAADIYMQYHLCDLIVPDGSWFMGRAMVYNRASYRIIFRDAEIRTGPYNEAFITCDFNGIGRDYTGLVAGMGVNKGQGFYKTNDTPGGGNCYRCVTSGTTAGTDPLDNTAINPATTYTWGTAQFRFEQYVGPGSVYNYNVAPHQFAEMEFINPSIFSFWGTGGGGVGADTDKWPDQMPDVSGEPVYVSGIVMRHRGIITNPQVYQCQSFGVALVADGDYFLKGSGNVDGFRVEHLVARFCGKAGFHTGLADGNAGYLSYADTSENGQAGLDDQGFLGNSYIAHQSAFDGVWGAARKQYPSGTVYNGYSWYCRAPVVGIDTLPTGFPHAFHGQEPGNPTNTAWTLAFGDGTQGISAKFTASISGTVMTVTAVASGTIAVGNMIVAIGSVTAGTKIVAGGSGSGGTGTYNLDTAQTVSSQTIKSMSLTNTGGGAYPDWNMTQKFEPAGAFMTNNYNARNVMIGFYIEGGTWPAQPCSRDLVIGGLLNSAVDRTRGATVQEDGSWTGVYSTAYQNFPTVGSRAFSTTFGTIENTHPILAAGTIYDGRRYGLLFAGGDGTDSVNNQTMQLTDCTSGGPGVTPIIDITLTNASETWGRTAAMPLAIKPHALMINDPVSTQGRYLFVGGGGPPTSGDYKQGDVKLNAGAAAGQPIAYSCTADSVAGNGGTWRAWPNLP